MCLNIYLRGPVQLGAVWDLGPTSVNKFLKMSLPTTKALSWLPDTNAYLGKYNRLTTICQKYLYKFFVGGFSRPHFIPVSIIIKTETLNFLITVKTDTRIKFHYCQNDFGKNISLSSVAFRKWSADSEFIRVNFKSLSASVLRIQNMFNLEIFKQSSVMIFHIMI